MNIQEYISSGIVESYSMGLTTQEERLEFEKMCATFPEVRAARDTFELLLEKQATENAVAAPAELKQKIADEILFGKLKKGGSVVVEFSSKSESLGFKFVDNSKTKETNQLEFS